jgi:hypothetical protein
MPFVFPGTRRTGRTLLAALGAALVCAAPASAAISVTTTTTTTSGGITSTTTTSACSVNHALSTPLASFGDTRSYALAPGGNLESGAQGWSLAGGAGVVLGNEPFHVGGTRHRYALQLPPGASATTARMCIDETYPLLRMFVRNVGALSGALKVEVLRHDPYGRTLTVGAGSLQVSSTAWTLSRDLRIALANTTGAGTPVSFRFTANGGDWRVDDVYVDPYARR